MFDLLILYVSSSHLRSAHHNVRKYVGISNFLTIANTLNKNCFQHTGVPLTELINKKSIVAYNKPYNCLLKLPLTAPAGSAPDLNLCIAKFIDERKWCCSTQTWRKKYNLHLMQNTDLNSVTFDESTKLVLLNHIEER